MIPKLDDKPPPTKGPTDAPPTKGPTDAPTKGPTSAPTKGPTDAPTKGPTDAPPRRSRLFLIAGQSNAEGNVALSGLRTMAAAIPQGTTLPLSDAARAAARTAVANSQGLGGCKSSDYRENTADVVIDALAASSVKWQAIDAGWSHSSVQMASAGFRHSKVTIHDPALLCHYADGTTGAPSSDSSASPSTSLRCLRETRVTTAAGKLEQVTVELGAYGVPFNFAAAGYDLSQVAIKSDWWSKRPKTGTVSMLQNGVWSTPKPYTVSRVNTNCGDRKTCFGDCKCSCCGDGSMGTSYNVVAQRSISLYRGVTQLRITFATTLSGNGGFIYNGLYVTTAAALGGGQSTTETENEAAAAIDVSEPCKNEIDRDATIRVGPELSQYGSPTG